MTDHQDETPERERMIDESITLGNEYQRVYQNLVTYVAKLAAAKLVGGNYPPNARGVLTTLMQDARKLQVKMLRLRADMIELEYLNPFDGVEIPDSLPGEDL